MQCKRGTEVGVCHEDITDNTWSSFVVTRSAAHKDRVTTKLEAELVPTLLEPSYETRDNFAGNMEDTKDRYDQICKYGM